MKFRETPGENIWQQDAYQRPVLGPKIDEKDTTTAPCSSEPSSNGMF